MTIAHSERSHAKLSASGSSRWLACPASVQLEDMFPETTSEYAEEGTAAHELSELHLSRYMEAITTEAYNKKHKEMQTGQYYSQDMEDYVQVYMDTVIEKINGARARTKDAVVLLEHRLDFSEWVPEGFGTGDVVIISDGVMEIIDLKYGKGVEVSAEGNSQMRLYALGALNEFGFLYGVETVRMTICQPRLNSVSTDELPADDLLQWAENTVKPAAEIAASGRGYYKAGEHCKFCAARSHCRTRAKANLELAKHEFKEAPLLSVEEIAEVLAKADALKAWATDISSYALEQAEKHGVKFPGWKLVEGRSNRTYADRDAVIDTLMLEGYDEGVIYEPREIKGITNMEKVIGKKKFTELLSDFIIKPAGKPKLAPLDDKRPEINSAAAAASDFE